MKPVAVKDGATSSSLVESTDVAFITVFYNKNHQYIVPEKDPSAIHDNLALALGHCVQPLNATHVRLPDDIVASFGPVNSEHLLLQGKSWEGEL